MSDAINEDMTLGHLAQMLARWDVQLWIRRKGGRFEITLAEDTPASHSITSAAPEGQELGPSLVGALRDFRHHIRGDRP